jgi:SWIM zinc finger
MPNLTVLPRLTISGIDTSKSKRARKMKGEELGEKRLKRFRQKPPQSYLERLERVKVQRMFLIDRNKTTNKDGAYEEVFDLAGSTGNIYQVTVGKVPKCTCPDAGKGNQCKHIVYVYLTSLFDQFSN